MNVLVGNPEWDVGHLIPPNLSHAAQTALDLGQFEGQVDLKHGGPWWFCGRFVCTGIYVNTTLQSWLMALVVVPSQQTSNKVLDKSWAGSNIQSQYGRSFVITWIWRFRNFGVNTKLYTVLHGDTVCLTGMSVHYCNQWKLFTWGRDQFIPNCVFLCEAAKNVR